VYRLQDPSPLIRIVGRSPIHAKVYERENLRCNLCLEVFTAEPPEGVGLEKYDATAGSMIALLKYGTGMPFHRLGRLQQSLGIPLPASTQWEIVAEIADEIKPVYEELIRQAAQGEVLHNDDTSMTVLALNGRKVPREKGERTGVFTTGVVSTQEGRKIALFFTGPKHAGENLADVLARRAAELGSPIQMCDGLDRNLPKDFEVILANCTAHARRYFVNVVENFPEECRYVLEKLGEVYKNDAVTREQRMSPDERLRFHQVHSRPVMEELQKWLTKQLVDKLVEPNSGLGRAITYFLKRWEPLTLFLRQAGGPRQQHHRACAEEGNSASKEQSLFQDLERCAGRRHLHEFDPHVRALGCRPVRLPGRAAEAPQRGQASASGLDALELSPGNRPGRAVHRPACVIPSPSAKPNSPGGRCNSCPRAVEVCRADPAARHAPLPKAHYLRESSKADGRAGAVVGDTH